MFGTLIHKYIMAARYRQVLYLGQLVVRRTRMRVMRGPFAGMQYIDRAIGSAYMPKLLGSYERELNHCVEAICAREPQLIVDIGTAEGYYAVGLALRNPQARVIGFEMEAAGREAVAALAAVNGAAGQVEMRGRCEPRDLADALGDAAEPVVVCDVEGHEAVLLDPAAVPALRRAAILVEVHEFECQGITALLQTRFGATHDIEHIWQQQRTRRDYPFTTLGTALVRRHYIESVVGEQRPWRMAWLWMTPRQSAKRD
jgi:hypothetical protein